MNEIEIGRLLRAGTMGFVVGCRVSQLEAPTFGALVRAPIGNDHQVYGLIYDLRIDDDGLIRQLVNSADVDEAIIADNRVNRNIPLELSVLAVGHRQGSRIRHLLPPRPPLSLDVIYLCDSQELCDFTAAGRFGYFRHILRDTTVPISELLAAHIERAQEAHLSAGQPEWANQATQELIALLRDNYPALMDVLGAINDALRSQN